jgi:hypothetical protein
LNKQWDAKEAVKAKAAAELAKTQAAGKIEDERMAKIDAGRKALGELVNAVDPKSPQAKQVIELINAFAVENGNGGDLKLLIAQSNDGLERLLGAYGYKGTDDVGTVNLASARLEYALSNYIRLTPQQRAEVEKSPVGNRYGIALLPTKEEIEAREQQKVNLRLPDGTNFQGTRAEYREASQRSIVNHALAQLQQIRSAGPMSLVGRMVDGERGAAIGAMLDAFTPVAQGMKARADMRNGPTGGGDNRTPIDDARRAPAPEKTPTRELQPDPPARGGGGPPSVPPSGPSGGSGVPASGNTTLGPPFGAERRPANPAPAGPAPAGSPQDNGAPAQSGKKPLAQTGQDMNTGAMDPDRVAKRDQQAKREEARALP